MEREAHTSRIQHQPQDSRQAQILPHKRFGFKTQKLYEEYLDSLRVPFSEMSLRQLLMYSRLNICECDAPLPRAFVPLKLHRPRFAFDTCTNCDSIMLPSADVEPFSTIPTLETKACGNSRPDHGIDQASTQTNKKSDGSFDSNQKDAHTCCDHQGSHSSANDHTNDETVTCCPPSSLPSKEAAVLSDQNARDLAFTDVPPSEIYPLYLTGYTLEERKTGLCEAFEEALHLIAVRHTFSVFSERNATQIYGEFSAISSYLPPHLFSFLELGNNKQRIVEYYKTNETFLQHVASRWVGFRNLNVCYDRVELKFSSLPLLEREPPSRMSKVGSVLRQFVREWTAEGAEERKSSYGKILAKLEELYPRDQVDRAKIRVLIPGCGLARLNYEVRKLGFSVGGNENSYHMLLPADLILNECERPEEYTLCPYGAESTNWKSYDDRFKIFTVPDEVPATLLRQTKRRRQSVESKTKAKEGESAAKISNSDSNSTADSDGSEMGYSSEEGEFVFHHSDESDESDYALSSDEIDPSKPEFFMLGGDFLEVTKNMEQEFDVVLTCFFLDTATDVFQYLCAFHNMLKHGGKWINFGPLLYHFSGVDQEFSLDLPWNEIKSMYIFFTHVFLDTCSLKIIQFHLFYFFFICFSSLSPLLPFSP